MPAKSSTLSKVSNEADPPEDVPNDQHDAPNAADGLRLHQTLNSKSPDPTPCSTASA
jgi:hypothetical protein